MPRPARSADIDRALRTAVADHPDDLVRHVSERLGLSRAAVGARARALVADGSLLRTGTTRPRFAPGSKRIATFRYARQQLAEDRVWSRDIAPLLEGLPANVVDIAHHGLTEMVNNAIDHSGGKRVEVYVERDEAKLAMHVADDGVGIFRKITRALDLPDERLALLELSKGKLTTDPRRHSGEGIFFTSRMFDRFQIVSGELVFDHDADTPDDLLYDVDPGELPSGTLVLMEISVSSPRIDREVFSAFSSGPDDYAFARTVVPVRLARIGGENLISRSQAKRLLQRVDRFRIVGFDFAGVEKIGQSFADEIFRVFANEHPAIELIAMNAVPEVQQMIRRAEVLRDEEAARGR